MMLSYSNITNPSTTLLGFTHPQQSLTNYICDHQSAMSHKDNVTSYSYAYRNITPFSESTSAGDGGRGLVRVGIVDRGLPFTLRAPTSQFCYTNFDVCQGVSLFQTMDTCLLHGTRSPHTILQLLNVRFVTRLQHPSLPITMHLGSERPIVQEGKSLIELLGFIGSVLEAPEVIGVVTRCYVMAGTFT